MPSWLSLKPTLELSPTERTIRVAIFIAVNEDGLALRAKPETRIIPEVTKGTASAITEPIALNIYKIHCTGELLNEVPMAA